MDLLIYIGGAVAFFALVMASIGLHEIGHLVPGKLFDVKTTEYFVGFGRTLWSRRRGETEYGVEAVPVGVCPAHRHVPPAKDRPDQVGRTVRSFQALADNARDAEWSLIQPEDRADLFYRSRSAS